MNKLTRENIENISNWLYQNGRDLDVCLYNHFFLGEDKENVLQALTLYLNEDGGFAGGLEPDLQNKNSNALATAKAFELLQLVGYRYDQNDELFNEVIDPACKWLFNQAAKDNKGRWSLIIPTNNDYPCAEWWKYRDDAYTTLAFNPTPALIGEIMLFTSPVSKYYLKAESMLTDILRLYLTNNVGDKNDLHNFALLWDALDKLNYSDDLIVDCKEKWLQDIDYALTRKSEQFKSPSSILLSDIVWDDHLLCGKFKDEISSNVEFLISSRTNAGLWVPNWGWGNKDPYYDIAYILWSSHLTVMNLNFISSFNGVEEGGFDE